MPAATLHKDADLRQRAQKVVPGGMWGHLNAANLPEGYPQFFASGEGATLVDVDGRRFIDFMCAWGPNYLGYRHPEVEEAVQRQLKAGDCLNGPGEAMVELAELFVDMIAAADWVQFQKNGTDATTTCSDDRAGGDGKAQGACRPRSLPRGRSLVLAVAAGRHGRGSRAHYLLSLQRSGKSGGSHAGGRRRSRGDPRFRLPARFRQGPGIANARIRADGARSLRPTLGRPYSRRGSGRAPARSRGKLGTSRRPARSLGLEQGDRQRLSLGRRHRSELAARRRLASLRDRLLLVRRGGHGCRYSDSARSRDATMSLDILAGSATFSVTGCTARRPKPV